MIMGFISVFIFVVLDFDLVIQRMIFLYVDVDFE